MAVFSTMYENRVEHMQYVEFTCRRLQTCVCLVQGVNYRYEFSLMYHSLYRTHMLLDMYTCIYLLIYICNIIKVLPTSCFNHSFNKCSECATNGIPIKAHLCCYACTHIQIYPHTSKMRLYGTFQIHTGL